MRSQFHRAPQLLFSGVILPAAVGQLRLCEVTFGLVPRRDSLGNLLGFVVASAQKTRSL